MKNILRYVLVLIFTLPQLTYAKINIVTTIKPLHSLISAVVQNIDEYNTQGNAEKKINVKLLLNFNSSPHHYSLKPSDVANLEQANIIFFVDRHLETYVHNFLNLRKNSDQTTVELSRTSGIVLLHQNQKFHQDKKHEVIDPHLWLSPENAKTIVQIIADIMCEYDSENADKYQNNANIYIKALSNVDHKINYLMNEVKEIPFAVSHDAYQYFIKHYGLNCRTALTLDDHHVPGVATLNKFSKLIQKENIKCVFADARESNQFLKSVIGNKAKICYLDAEWGVNEAQRNKKNSEAYLIMLQNIAENIYGCLKRSMVYTVPNR